MSTEPAAGSNPFSTRYIRPGTLRYIFPPGVSAESVASALQVNHWRGSIIGPHGSGKSSLLATLIPLFAELGRQVIHVQLHGGQHSLVWPELKWNAWNENTLLIVDGYEQLSLWQRLLVRSRTSLRHAGLLVTAHTPVHLPIIFATQPTLELAFGIVQQVLPEADDRITPADVAEAYAAQRGDLREMLLRLYDVFRERA